MVRLAALLALAIPLASLAQEMREIVRRDQAFWVLLIKGLGISVD